MRLDGGQDTLPQNVAPEYYQLKKPEKGWEGLLGLPHPSHHGSQGPMRERKEHVGPRRDGASSSGTGKNRPRVLQLLLTSVLFPESLLSQTPPRRSAFTVSRRGADHRFS